MSGYALDANKYHFKRTFGDVTVLGSWLRVDGVERSALVLLQTKLIGKKECIPCAVPVTHAWLWAEETGDPAHAVRNSLIYAQTLGLNPANPRDVLRVTKIIRECLGDLLSMPPKPTERVVVADAIAVDRNTGKTHHAEITENV